LHSLASREALHAAVAKESEKNDKAKEVTA
jgi:hypothetical protein